MRSTTIAATLMAMASAVTAQKAGFAVFANPAMDEVVFAGKPYTLKWVAGKDATGKDYTGPATLSLIGGETQVTQQPIGNLATLDVSTNTYTWNVDCSLGKAKVYGLAITLASEPTTFQWSNRFHIDNSGCPGENGNPGSASSSAASSAVSSAAPSATSAASSGAAYPTATTHASSSSAAVTSSSQSSASATVSSAVVPTLTKSSSAAATTSSATKPAATASQSSTGATPIPTAAAPKVAAGSFALAGAAIAAVLAL